ncbi:hypothetical protein [Glaciecola sp. SC05]|uniref:hypothetical protein n=1 Tax=Glaciecola sp. SC05 TaxID=1987355 RepID=UPI0035292E96
MRIIMLCALVFCAQFVQAQSTQSIEKCAQTENDLLRLICYDELFTISKSGSVNIDTEVDSELAQSSQTEVPQSISITAPPVVATPPMNVPTNELDSVAVKPSTQTQTQENLIDRFGAEDLDIDDKNEELTRIDSVIEAVTENKRNIRTFTLANGQIWRETESSRLRIKDGMSVYIEKGAFSAHFLGKEDSNRRVRVKRVK